MTNSLCVVATWNQSFKHVDYSTTTNSGQYDHQCKHKMHRRSTLSILNYKNPSFKTKYKSWQDKTKHWYLILLSAEF